MYDVLRRFFYWPHIANDVYKTVKYCRSCAINRKINNKQRKLCRFLPSGPLKFVAMDMLRPVAETKSGSQFIVLLTDKRSKLTKAIPTV